MKVVIVSPRQVGGGQIVLHILCRELSNLGIDAKILYVQGEGKTNKQSTFCFWFRWCLYNIRDFFRWISYSFSLFIGLNVCYKDYFYEPIKYCKRKWLPFIDKNTIVVYPDIIYGNILKANYVVRWLLYFNRFPNDKNAYGERDLFFCYREIFNDYQLNPECRTLWFQNFDFGLYKQTNFGERDGCCYVVRKGIERSDLPEKLSGPIIDDWDEELKVKELNKCKYCYFYDTQTFYTAIAAVCGCIPVVVLEPDKTKEDYLGNGEHPVGVAYGDSEEEIAYAINTREECIRLLADANNNNAISAEYFVKVCKEYFNINN